MIYPGARVDLFGESKLGRPLPPAPNGTYGRPLRVCFAGLQMGSKGPHTVLEALLQLKEKRVPIHLMLAGGTFQADYAKQLRRFCTNHQLNGQVDFLPQLNREQLAVFSKSIMSACSVHPPRSLWDRGSRGDVQRPGPYKHRSWWSRELFEDGISGLHYPAGNSAALAERLERLAYDPALLHQLQKAGEKRVRHKFSVDASVQQLETLLSH